MTEKPKYIKGKHHQSKKSRALQRHGIPPHQQPASADTPQPAAAVSAAPLPGAPAPSAKPKTIQYPYFASELRRISFLAVVIIVILIVLAQVLS